MVTTVVVVTVTLVTVFDSDASDNDHDDDDNYFHGSLMTCKKISAGRATLKSEFEANEKC